MTFDDFLELGFFHGLPTFKFNYVKADNSVRYLSDHMWVYAPLDNLDGATSGSGAPQFPVLKIDDDFFLSCPNLVGDITREICDRAAQPFPSFAFSAATATVGALYGYVARTGYRPNCSNLYFMNLAPYGSGKDYAQKTMINAIERQRATRHLTTELRSTMGTFKRISDGGSLQIIIQDEAKHFFDSLRASNVAAHMTGVKPILYKLFSSWNSPCFDAGTVVSEANKLAPLSYPTLSYLGISAANVHDMFKAEDFTGGFISRFIVLSEDKPAIDLLAIDQTDDPFKFEASEAWLRLFEMQEQFESSRNHYLEKNLPVQFLRIPYDVDALEAYQGYSRMMKIREDDIKAKGYPWIYGRAVEIVGRVALAISYPKPSIGVDCVEWAIRLVEGYLANFPIEEAIDGEFGEWCRKVRKVIDKAGKNGIVKRDLYRKCHFLKGQSAAKTLNDILNSLLESGDILTQEVFIKGTRKTTKVKHYYGNC
jgi:hypothetical protein